MHHALINTNTRIGKACIINSKALVEHDCEVKDFCHLSTASVLNGGCTLGEGSFLGSNMIIPHATTIAPQSVLYHNPLESSQRYGQVLASSCESTTSDSGLLTGGGDKVKTPFLIAFPTPTFSLIVLFYTLHHLLFHLFALYFITRSSHASYPTKNL